jgi:hypothetical protein
MQIEFMVGGQLATFERNWFTGRAQLRVGNAVELIQDPLDPRSHFSLSRVRTWRTTSGPHSVTIEKTRPLFLAGIRPQAYRVLVDGKVVVEKKGY